MSKFKELLLDILDKVSSPYIANEFDEDLKRVSKGDKPKSNTSKLYSLIAWCTDEVESSNEKIMLWDNIDYAQGRYLDRIGANYGVDRQGANDVFYRLMIKVKMLAQLSGGDVDTILNATSILLGIPPEKIIYESLFPAKMRITVLSDDLPDDYLNIADIVARQIKRVMVAGVGFELCIEIKENFNETLYIGGAVTSQFNIKDMRIHKQLEDLSMEKEIYIGSAITSTFSYMEVMTIE